jgi:hypothetical protein
VFAGGVDGALTDLADVVGSGLPDVLRKLLPPGNGGGAGGESPLELVSVPALTALRLALPSTTLSESQPGGW